MTKSGLAILADTYGLKRDELHHLKLVAKRLFEEIREEISRMTSKPIRTGLPVIGIDEVGVFSANQPRRHFVAVSAENGVAAIMRMDFPVAQALIRAVLRHRSRYEGVRSEAMTALEAEVLCETASATFLQAANRTLAPSLGTRQAMRPVRVADPDEAAAILGSGHQVISANVECEFDGVAGWLALAFAPWLTSRIRAGLAAQSRQSGTEQQAARARRTRASGVAGARLSLSAVLGNTVMSLAQIRGMAPGSIIFLHKMDDESVPQVELRCIDTPLFSGTVVRDRGWYRFVIEQRMWNHAKTI